MNSLKSDYQLARRAVELFPRTVDCDLAAVRHARRKWINAVHYLRDRSGKSKWVLDTLTERATPRPPTSIGITAWGRLARAINRGQRTT